MERDANGRALLRGSRGSLCGAQSGREKRETLFTRFLHTGICETPDKAKRGGGEKARELLERTQT